MLETDNTARMKTITGIPHARLLTILTDLFTEIPEEKFLDLHIRQTPYKNKQYIVEYWYYPPKI